MKSRVRTTSTWPPACARESKDKKENPAYVPGSTDRPIEGKKTTDRSRRSNEAGIYVACMRARGPVLAGCLHRPTERTKQAARVRAVSKIDFIIWNGGSTIMCSKYTYALLLDAQGPSDREQGHRAVVHAGFPPRPVPPSCPRCRPASTSSRSTSSGSAPLFCIRSNSSGRFSSTNNDA